MPKVNTRQSHGPRAPTINYKYQTSTVQKLRDELSRYGIQPNTWIKKLGLIAMLKAAIKQSATEEHTPHVVQRRDSQQVSHAFSRRGHDIRGAFIHQARCSRRQP